MGASLLNIPAVTGAARPYTIPGITCRFWRANPATLRNGPIQGLGSAGGAGAVRRKLAGSDDGDRQMVSILSAVLTDGLPAVEAACAGRSSRASTPPT